MKSFLCSRTTKQDLGHIKTNPRRRGFVLRLARVIYLWQQPDGHTGQCGGQGHCSMHTAAYIIAKSIITSMMIDFFSE